MRVKRMVRTSQHIHELLVCGDSAVNCSGCAQCYVVDAIAEVHLSCTIKQARLLLVKQSKYHSAGLPVSAPCGDRCAGDMCIDLPCVQMPLRLCRVL